MLFNAKLSNQQQRFNKTESGFQNYIPEKQIHRLEQDSIKKKYQHTGKQNKFTQLKEKTNLIRHSHKHRDQQIFDLNQFQQLTKTNKKVKQTKQNSQQEDIGLIQNYLGSHNKFKTYFKSKKYKKIYHQLAKQMPLEKSYYSLYMQDKLFALNKHIKISLVHKQTSFEEYLNPYFQSGRSIIEQYYNYFLMDHELYKGTKKVNIEALKNNQNGKYSNSTQFLYILITFLHQQAIFHRSKSQRPEAKIFFEANLKIILKILQSSTSCCRLRRKICQNLISFSSFLIENRQLLKAQKILSIVLTNCINLIGIIQVKLVYSQNGKMKNNFSDGLLQKSKKLSNRKLKEALQFLMSIYLNSAVVYELQNKQYLSFLALNQVKCIENVLYKRYSIKSRVTEIIKKPKQSFEYHNQQIHIVDCYFNFKSILKNISEQKQFSQNVHTAIYGINIPDRLKFQKTKTLEELFFINKKNDLQPKKNNSKLIYPSKIALIQYEDKIECQQNDESSQKYVINMKKTNGSQLNNASNQTKQPLTIKKQPSNRHQQMRRQSIFYKQISHVQNLSPLNQQTDINLKNKIQHIQLDQNQRKKTIIKQKTIDKSNKVSELVENYGQNQNKFLDFFIQSQIRGKNYFLFGKQFAMEYQAVDQGKKTINQKLMLKEQKDKSQYLKSNNNSKKNQGQKTKQNLKNQRIENKFIPNRFIKNKVDQKDWKHKSLYSSSSQKNSKQNVSSFQGVKPDNIYSSVDQNRVNQINNKKRRSMTSVKQGPKSYKQIMSHIQKKQQQFLKKDYLQKNSIYRLKCRSQNLATKKYSGNNSLALNIHRDSLNINKNENQREVIKFKMQKSDKIQNIGREENKQSGLLKKTIHTSLFSNNQTGIRLLKKIIFKHKKTLKITKNDLFVNYNKNQGKQDDIKLVQRQSLLLVQYNMCEEEIKVRIKSNMQQLILDNLRNSEQNQKRVQNLNRAINEYEKNKRLKEFNLKMKQSYQNVNQTFENFSMIPSPKFFAETFENGNKNVQQGQDDFVDNFGNTAAIGNKISDNVIISMLKGKDFSLKNGLNIIGGSGQKLLTSNKTSNPNLFLSSIKFTATQKQQFQSLNIIKSLNNQQVNNQQVNEMDKNIKLASLNVNNYGKASNNYNSSLIVISQDKEFDKLMRKNDF